MKNKRSDAVNISTIANLAQTSIMTVSRVLNNKPDVSDETRRKIMKIIEDLQYKPHSIARRLSGGKTNIIGLALYRDGNPLKGLYADILQGLQPVLADFYYDLLLLAPSKQNRYDHRVLHSTLLDGVIVMGDLTSEEDVLNFKDEIPFLTIGRRKFGEYEAPFVAPNYAKAYQEAVEHALRLGANRISIIITGLNNGKHNSNQERINGIYRAQRNNRLGDDHIHFIPSTGHFSDGYQLFMEQSLSSDLIILDSSEFSFGAVIALRDRKLLTNGAVKLVGMDYENHLIRRCEDVSNTKIPKWQISWDQVGGDAARQLLRIVNGEHSDSLHHLVDFDFIV